MAVVRSPFSSGTDNQNIFEQSNPTAKQPKPKGVGVVPTTVPEVDLFSPDTIVSKDGTAKIDPFGKSANKNYSTSKQGGLKTSPAQEGAKLNASYNKAVAKIAASGTMTQKQKNKAISTLDALVNQGDYNKSIVDTPLSLLKSALGAGVEATGTAVKKLGDATQFVSRGLQSGFSELDDTAQSVFGGAGTALQAMTGNPISKIRLAVDLLPFIEAPKKDTKPKGSFTEFVSQTKDKNFMPTPTGNKFVDLGLGLGESIVFDPTTYMGVGSLNYIGKAGRTALAVKFGSTEMLTKYPQLAGTLDDIMRYGASVIPKEVRAAEGIDFGIRFAGKVVPKTEILAKTISGKAGIGSNIRAGIGDVIGKSQLGNKARIFATPSSRIGLATIGAGRKLGLDDQQIINEIANYTAANTAKGYRSVAYAHNLDGFRDTLKAIRDAGFENDIHRLVEDADLLARESNPLKREFANKLKVWQDGLREEVNAVYKKFNVDYTAGMTDIGFVDNYVHHRITDDALRWMYKDKSRNFNKFGFRTGDLTQAEIGANSGAAMYRKIGKPRVMPDGTLEKVTFMNEPVLTGTIDELNGIYAKAVGIPDAKFFHTDIASIADSYAYSMATARGREAYVRRLLDFGGNVAEIINKKAVPDAALVKNLTGVHADILKVRRALATAVNGGTKAAVKSANEAVAFAGKALGVKAGELRVIDSKVAVVRASIAKIEKDLSAAYVLAAAKGEAARGAFLDVHKALIEDIGNIKIAIDAGKATELVAHDSLKAVYLQLNPDAKRIPSASKMLDNVNRKLGISDSAQLKELEKRMAGLQTQLNDIINIDPQQMNDLRDLEASLSQQIDGHTVLADVKFKADYSEDGLVYGVADDLVVRPFDPNTDPMYRVVSTRPIITGGAELTTDEMAAARNAFLTAPDSVAVHAMAPEQILDMRKPEVFAEFWDPEGGVGDAVAFALRQSGLDNEGVFKSTFDDLLEGGDVDPMFEQVYPELSDLMAMVTSMQHQVFDGVVPDSIHTDSFDVLRSIFDDVAANANLENSDVVGGQMLNDFMRAMVEEGVGNTGKPLLFPSGVVYGSDNAMADGAYSLLLPDRFNYASIYGQKNLTPEMMKGTTAPVHFTAGDEFIQSITDGDLHSASFEAMQMQEQVMSAGDELSNALVARDAVRAEVSGVSGKVGGLKSQGSRRMKAAEKAHAEYQASGLVEIMEAGRKVKVTRERAITILNKKEEKLNNSIALLNDRIGKMTGNADVSILKRKTEQEARLSTLLDSRRVIERWTEKTGNALREDIDNLSHAIAFDPPAGQAGTDSRAWATRVNARIDAVAKLENTPVKKAWERITTQLGADEAQLAYLDSVVIPDIIQQRAAAMEGLVGSVLRDDIKAGWHVLEGLGVQIPPEMAAIMMPNIDRLANRAEWGMLRRAYMEYHQMFKTYATMSTGFLVRNAMSATFMNSVAGVSTENMRLGIQATKALRKHGVDGWLGPKGLNITDPAEIKMWQEALRGAEATGRGVAEDFRSPIINGGAAHRALQKVQKNRLTDAFAKGNDLVERAVRLPMALDTLKSGGTFDDAVYRISRYHFDYTDLSAMDEAAKQFIPFWIWTTKNLPLQWTEQLLRPSSYNAYNQLKERNPVTADIAQPSWLSESGPMGLFNDWVLNPDLPMSRMGSTAKGLTTLSGLGGQLNPLIKAPIEHLAGKTLGTNVPFAQEAGKAKGLDKAIAKGLELIGVDSRNAEGQLTISPELSTQLGSIIPLLGKAERLSGGLVGGKPTYNERWLTSVLTELGVPVRKVGPRQQRGELISRQFKLSDLMKALENRGMVQK